MDWLAFVASLVGSLAWPLAAVALAIVFRPQLEALFRRPSGHVKAGPFEADWNDAVRDTQADLAVVSPASGDALSAQPAGRVDGPTMAETAPVQAVLDAYRRVEQALQQRLQGGGVEVPRHRSGGPASVVVTARVARDHELITEQTAEAIRGLQVLRNLAVHGPQGELDAQKATEFVALADASIYAILAKG
jgi:hypothetical protein